MMGLSPRHDHEREDSMNGISRSRAATALMGCALLALGTLGLAGPSAAQSTGPVHLGYDPNAPIGGHFHEGELGELSLMIEHSLRCNCSCGLDVHSCQFQMQCGVSPGWSERIRRSLAAGETPEAIQAGFVADFGTTVLMAPPAEGFNLVGYLLPSVAIVMAGVFIGLFVRRRAGQGPRPAPVTELGEEDAQRLRTELQKLDEAEGPDW
jgi:cytochrome c-type biogenesis protein CcmH/NrfF